MEKYCLIGQSKYESFVPVENEEDVSVWRGSDMSEYYKSDEGF